VGEKRGEQMNKNWAIFGIVSSIMGILCNLFAYLLVSRNSYFSALLAFIGFVPSAVFSFFCIINMWQDIFTKKRSQWCAPLGVVVVLTVGFCVCSFAALYEFNQIKNELSLKN